MIRMKTILYSIVLAVAATSAASAQNRIEPPAGPFKAVHLMTMTGDQEAKYMAAVKDVNQAFAKQGCPACAYHVFKVGVASGGKYDHMQISDWPSREVYVKIHASEDFRAATKRNPIMEEMEKTQFYDRFVELK